MTETGQKLAFTHPIVVLKSGLKNNWMKKLDRVNRPLDEVLKKRASKKRESTQIIKHSLKAIWPNDKRLMF